MFSIVSKRLLLFVAGFAFSLGGKPVYAQTDGLPELQNLQTLGQQAQTRQLPILLLFSAEWCEYCQVLKEKVLNPMIFNGMYQGKVVYLRHVGLDEKDPIPDWNGKPMIKSKWAYQLNADLTPTIAFFDGNGKEVAERIVGISEITLFASLIHSRINEAYKNMGLNKRIPATPELLEKQKGSM
ncbi:thioredoxin family protein [Thiomicrorhabdus xiamenensis]|uniref:Thioredoxin family protein n=1 Tax=Thiomicrorhabdus xiamenensis TaxID=2739063 RepID=A0A7D4SHF3_9GAMM|nr:thioredoxin family protein [Thiomicrorhabdus xiamenensis]QKI88180.1 thioredoxin family protein [Thiomicrorhabdus xiamenensis]